AEALTATAKAHTDFTNSLKTYFDGARPQTTVIEQSAAPVPDIRALLDEALAAFDARFQEQHRKEMEALRESNDAQLDSRFKQFTTVQESRFEEVAKAGRKQQEEAHEHFLQLWKDAAVQMRKDDMGALMSALDTRLAGLTVSANTPLNATPSL
ncbi:hypothetical protein, partial [Chryseobacterium contaminans]|uniref:hypothetical protein n=1 Tax=Chryseobacterium contaminans TaxID=1423959 RepID=UPI001E46DB50